MALKPLIDGVFSRLYQQNGAFIHKIGVKWRYP